MSKRKLSLYGLLVTVLVVATPYFIGQFIEIKYQELLPRLSEFDGIDIQPISYERHWRYSEAKSRVTLSGIYARKLMTHQGDDQHLSEQNFSFILEHKVFHGPLIKIDEKQSWQMARAIVLSKLFLTEEAQKAIAAEAGSTDLLSLRSEVDLFDSDIDMVMDAKSFRTRGQKPTDKPAWGGLNAHWRINSSLDEFRARVIVPAFNLKIYDAFYQSEDLMFTTERKRVNEGIWEGKGTLKCQKLKVDDKNDALDFTAIGTFLSGGFFEKDGMVNSSGLFRVEYLDDHQSHVGPILSSLSINRVPADIFYYLQAMARDIKNGVVASDQLFSQPQLLAAIPKLLAARPAFELERVFVKTDEGAVEGMASFVVGGDTINVLDIQAVTKSIQAKADFKVPQSILEQWLEFNRQERNAPSAQETVAQWIQAGYLVHSGSRLAMQLTIDQGQLVINGMKIDLLSLLS